MSMSDYKLLIPCEIRMTYDSYMTQIHYIKTGSSSIKQSYFTICGIDAFMYSIVPLPYETIEAILNSKPVFKFFKSDQYQWRYAHFIIT